MRLTTLDWLIVIASIAISFLPALVLARRAGSSTVEFFTSGRAAPWWLLGVSMVATTFSTDTPKCQPPGRGHRRPRRRIAEPIRAASCDAAHGLGHLLPAGAQLTLGPMRSDWR